MARARFKWYFNSVDITRRSRETIPVLRTALNKMLILSMFVALVIFDAHITKH